MQNDSLFYEDQHFTQWWLWLILFGINALSLYAVFRQIVTRVLVGTNPMGDHKLLITAGMLLLLTFVFRLLKLETKITPTGISVRFFPFQLNFRHYPYSALSKIFVRQYKPIQEYGGWGIRGFGKDVAYTVSGSFGLQLVFNDNKKLLIGTNRPDQITATLADLKQIKP